MTGLWLRPAFIVGLFLTSLLVAPLHNVQGEKEELEGVPEELPEECRSYIKKVLKEHGTGSIEHTSLESEADGTGDDTQDASSLNEQGDGLSIENKVEDGAKADWSKEKSVEVNVQKTEDRASVHAEDQSDDAPISDKTAKNDAQVEDSKGHTESASIEGGISIENIESRESIQLSKEDSIEMTKKLKYNKWTKVEELIDDSSEKEKKPKAERRYGKWTKSEELETTSVEPNLIVENESIEGKISEESIDKLSKETKPSAEKTTKQSKESGKKGKYGKWTKWEELENESREDKHAEEKVEQVKTGKRGKYGKWTKWEEMEDDKSEQVVTQQEQVAQSEEKQDKGKGRRGRYGKWTKWEDFEGQSEEAFAPAAAVAGTMKTVTKKEEPIRTGKYGKWTKLEDFEGESTEDVPSVESKQQVTTKTEKSDRSGKYGKWTKWEDLDDEETPEKEVKISSSSSSSSKFDESSIKKGRYGKWTKWEDFENEEEAMAPASQDKKVTVETSSRGSGDPARRGRYGKWTKWEDFENEEDAYAPAVIEKRAAVQTSAANVETSQTDEPKRRGRYGKWTKWEDFENIEEAYAPPALSEKQPVTITTSKTVETSRADKPERRGRYGKWTKWEDFENIEEAYAPADSERKVMTVQTSAAASHTDKSERRGRYGKWTKWEDFENIEEAYASSEGGIAITARVSVESRVPGRRPRYGKWTKLEDFDNEEEAYLSVDEVHQHQTTASSVMRDESEGRKGRYGKWTKWEDFDAESEESAIKFESPLPKHEEPIDRKFQPYGKWTVVDKLDDQEKLKSEEKEDIKVKQQTEAPIRKDKYGKWTKLEASEETKETISDQVKQIEEQQVPGRERDVSVEKIESVEASLPAYSEEIAISVEKSVEYISSEKPATGREAESIETLEIESQEKESIEKVMSVERDKSTERSTQVVTSDEQTVESVRSTEKSSELEKQVEKDESKQVVVSIEKEDKSLDSVISADDESINRIKSAEKIEEEVVETVTEAPAKKVIQFIVKEAEPIAKKIVEKTKMPKQYEKEVEIERIEVKRHEEMSAETKEYKDGQETPEEELIRGVKLPENLRSRDHINKLLKLDEENEMKERALENVANVILKDLKKLYDEAIKPLETLYKYRDLSNRHFGDPEIFSKPLVLFMGPWSGGKSSIINYLLNIEYNDNALRTGAEPSPAYFNILMHGDHTEVLDGTQLAADWTFSGLQKFGQGMLDRLRGLKLKSKLLEKVNIVEIPGILEIRKQVQRLFPFNDACQWFIDRADIIFLVYDPSKLDVGPETEAILDQLKGREYQSRIILNKADQVKPEELMRVQGTLIWNISPLMSSVEPPIMYSTSLWSMPYEAGAPIRLLQAQERALLRDLRSAITKKVEHKIASARRFAVRVRNHAKMVDCYLTTYYNHKSFFGNKKDVSDKIIENPQNYHIYEGLSTLTNISRYDLPDPDVYRDFFRLNTLYDFPLLSTTCTYFRGCPINRLDVAIAYDLPELVGQYKKLAETTLRKYDPNYSAS